MIKHKAAVFWRKKEGERPNNKWNMEVMDMPISPDKLREAIFSVYEGVVGQTIEFKLKAIMPPGEEELGTLIDL